MFGLVHIFRLFLVIALLLQTALPVMATSKDGFDATSYLCNVTGGAVTTETENHLRDIFRLAGKDLPGDNDTSGSQDHCQNCLVTFAAHFNPAFVYQAALRIAYRAESFQIQTAGFHYQAQGPPLGGRAPPPFT